MNTMLLKKIRKKYTIYFHADPHTDLQNPMTVFDGKHYTICFGDVDLFGAILPPRIYRIWKRRWDERRYKRYTKINYPI